MGGRGTVVRKSTSHTLQTHPDEDITSPRRKYLRHERKAYSQMTQNYSALILVVVEVCQLLLGVDIPLPPRTVAYCYIQYARRVYPLSVPAECTR